MWGIRYRVPIQISVKESPFWRIVTARRALYARPEVCGISAILLFRTTDPQDGQVVAQWQITVRVMFI